MKTLLASLLLAMAAPALAQDTPAWWPPPLVLDSVPPGHVLIYERPLAQYNDPANGRAIALVALRDPINGAWWRAIARHEDVSGALPGDTVRLQAVLP